VSWVFVSVNKCQEFILFAVTETIWFLMAHSFNNGKAANSKLDQSFFDMEN